MNTFILQYTRRHRLLFVAVWAAILATLVAVALPTYAAEQPTQVDALPFVNNFATARFKLLATLQSGDTKFVAYGGGEAVMPDRSSTWLGNDQSKDLIYVIQVGTTVYQRVGNGPWQRTDGAGGMDGLQFQPLSAQFNLIQTKANAILNFGNEMVSNVPTTRYQVWLSGDKALELAGNSLDTLPADVRDIISQVTYKYDFWIGTQDSFLHQQNVEIMVPEMNDVPNFNTNVLTTFYDINDPNISVNAPQ